MARTVLPSGEELKVSPEEILRYINPDGLRQLLRQERLRWNLKTNKDVDYLDNTRLFKYSSEIHNEGNYQRMEIRTFPDNGAYPGYAGVNVDSGLLGITHNLDKWDKALSDESLNSIVNRVLIGAMATVKNKSGFGLSDEGLMTDNTENRMAAMVFDPIDGRTYLMSNDNPRYVNNETRSVDERIPDRAVARIVDIPTRLTQLKNDFDFVSDPDYHHTDNNFTNSNRYILDNIDDRTFVYPEISCDKNGEYIKNNRIGLNGENVYNESDGNITQNTQPDVNLNTDIPGISDRQNEAINSYNKNKNFSGVNHESGYLPGVFRSLEELESVDLVGQKMKPRTHADSPGAKRINNYYLMDGIWSPNWYNRIDSNNSYLAQSLNPNNMEMIINNSEPIPYKEISHTNKPFHRGDLYQWRYNRITTKYYAEDISIQILESGQKYKVGDILRWNFGDDVFLFEVTMVGPNGQIQSGSYKPEQNRIYEQNPSTNNIGIEFANMSGIGYGAKLIVSAKATIENNSTQIKNNLYAYVDITPTIRSDNSTPWSDVNMPDTYGGKVAVRSTAAGPAYSGINSGRGGPSPSDNTSASTFYEHGGNATAGVHVHLFRYVIDTQNPTWVIENGVQVFTGRWVDQGPMGVERPCDIKALLFSNPDTNNFNNYYKFMLDLLFDNMNRNPDGVITNNENSVSGAYIHIDNKDPASDRRFTQTSIDGKTNSIIEVDITSRVLYINAATGVMFVYNNSYKNDPTFGYGLRAPGWISIAGTTAR